MIGSGKHPFGRNDDQGLDFDRLRREFARSLVKNTLVQELKERIDRKLARMVRQNPTRLDLYTRYQAIIAAYNQETDRVVIEQTFAELLRIIEDMSDEERRVVREGLIEELFGRVRPAVPAQGRPDAAGAQAGQGGSPGTCR